MCGTRLRSVVLLAGLAVHPLPACAADPPPVTVFVAKTIHTMDAGWPSATAVAVRGGKILGVGSLDDVKLYLGKTPFTTDETFKDKVLMPGFIEPHGHPLNGAIVLTRPMLSYLPVAQAYGPDFPGIKTAAEATAKLKEYVAAETDPKRMLIVWGYDVVAMGRHLDKAFLDAISTTQPLLVMDASEHFVYANTPALGLAGVTKESAKATGFGLGNDGELNGQ